MKYGKDEAMLNKVVLNMATIMECYFNFMKLTTITNDANLIKLCKARLSDLRLYYFNQSFIISETLLLPQEKNIFFFDMVISKTIRILKEHPQNIYYKLKNLYNDLLDWTKRKIKKKQDGYIQNLCQTQPGCSTSSHAHVTPPNIANGSDNTLSKNINSQNLNTLTLFSGGTPGNEITINVDTRYLRNNNIDNVSAQCATTSYREVQNLSLPSTFTSTNNASTGIVNQPKEKTLVGPCFLQTNSQQYINLESTNISPLNNNVLIVQTMQTDQQDISKRSLSRDSGIISPDTFDASSEKKNSSTCQRVYQSNGVVTLPIAPNVSHGVNTALHLCFVCGKATELVCLGCSKYYYCSTNCQESQWEEHKQICHLIPKNNLMLTNNLYNVI